MEPGSLPRVPGLGGAPELKKKQRVYEAEKICINGYTNTSLG